MTTDKPAVLFVCVHNAGRSQMAAGYLTVGATTMFNQNAHGVDQLAPRMVSLLIASQDAPTPTASPAAGSTLAASGAAAIAGTRFLLAGVAAILVRRRARLGR